MQSATRTGQLFQMSPGPRMPRLVGGGKTYSIAPVFYRIEPHWHEMADNSPDRIIGRKRGAEEVEEPVRKKRRSEGSAQVQSKFREDLFDAPVLEANTLAYARSKPYAQPAHTTIHIPATRYLC